MPSVSIVVPNYNHARFLRKRLETILAQTYQDFELILLDDCSTDDSRAVLREYASDPRVRVEFNDVNSGSTFKQWNKGLSLARGKCVWIAESDDYSDPRFLERMISLLDADQNITVAYCRSWFAFEDDTVKGFADGYAPEWDPEGWKSDFCMDGRRMCREYFCGANRIPNASAAVFRKAAYDRVGGADETLRLCGDWKLWAAVALEGRVAYTAQPLNYFRHHPASLRTKTRIATVALELLSVSQWVRQRVDPPSPDVLKMVYLVQAGAWVPAVTSFRLQRETKRQIMRLVAACDPHPARTAARFLPKWAGAVIFREFAKVWYPFLKVTYRFRHATGLTRNSLAQTRANLGGKP